MVYAVYRQAGDVIDYTPGSNVSAGDVVVLGDTVAIAKTDIAAGKVGSLATEGVFEVVKGTGEGTDISVGAAVFWDSTNKIATTSSSGTKYIGRCDKAATISNTTVWVKLLWI